MVRDASAPSPRLLDQPDKVALLANEIIASVDDDREHFWVILLNARNQYLMHSEISVGTLSSSLVHPRNVFGPALREGAASLVLVHNHPSGDPTPSREDIRLTRQLVEASRLLDLQVHDHIVIGNGTDAWKSFAQMGLI